MNIVLDTNVLLAGFFTRGVCEAVLDVCILDDRYELFLSAYILDEFQRIAQEKFSAPAKDVREATRYLKRHCRLVKPGDAAIDHCPDPDDLPVLGTAIAASAAALVTGDKELLAMREVQDIPILSPRDFYESIR